ncbi:MAG TPA: hypothetical protein DCE31_11380 [Lautropia sp.]|nr:hypothetical protein [Lautropia sp.]
MRDAEQKGLRIEQEQREVAEQQSRLLRDLKTELGSRLEQIQAGLQQPVDLLRQGLSSSSDALRGVIATGLDSVAVQLAGHQQLASERLTKLLDDVSLTAIRIEQGQQREATVLRSDMGNLAREINSDLQHTRDALQTNLAHSLSEVREISVLQQRSLSEILSQLQEQTATLLQSLTVSLEGLDKNFLNHIEKITGGQASMRENFAELAKTSLAFRRSSEQLTSLSRSIGRIERLASDVAGFGGQIQSLAQTAEKLQSDSRRSQQLEDQIVRLQASFQTFASSIARIDTLGPYIEQLHQESLKNVDFNAFIESLDARFQPLSTQAYAEKSTKLIATDLGRLQQMSGALQTLIEQHLQRLQVLEITVSQQIAERIEEGIRQQSLLREDLLNRAAQQDDLLRLSISQLIQNLEKATSPLARADLINQSINQLKELQVGYQVQLEETTKQRQREQLIVSPNLACGRLRVPQHDASRKANVQSADQSRLCLPDRRASGSSRDVRASQAWARRRPPQPDQKGRENGFESPQSFLRPGITRPSPRVCALTPLPQARWQDSRQRRDLSAQGHRDQPSVQPSSANRPHSSGSLASDALMRSGPQNHALPAMSPAGLLEVLKGSGGRCVDPRTCCVLARPGPCALSHQKASDLPA